MKFNTWAIMSVVIRIIAFFPVLYLLASGFDAFRSESPWVKPLHQFWYLPATNLLFGMLCLIPYLRVFFRRKSSRWFFLAVIVITSLAFARFHLFPFEYISPEAKNDPQHRTDFMSASLQPNGSGFRSSREIGGLTIWIVEKPFWSVWTIAGQLLLAGVPLALFLIKSRSLSQKKDEMNCTSQP